MLFNQIINIVILIWCVEKISSENFHGFTKSCSEESPECLKDFIQSALKEFLEGIPELGINCLDPFEFKQVEFSLPSGLIIEFFDGQSTGFKKCIVDSFSKNETNFEITTKCNLFINGSYKSSGRMLMFPVNGEGDFTIKCDKIKIRMNFQYNPYITTGGDKHLEIKHVGSEHLFNGRVRYNFSNIFKGNPFLSKTVLDFMNNNWRLVAEEFGKPIVNYGVTEIIHNVNKLLRLVPIDKLISK